MAQLVASIFGVVLGGVGEVVGSDFARDEIFTASIGSVDSLYLSVYMHMSFWFYGVLISLPAMGSTTVCNFESDALKQSFI